MGFWKNIKEIFFPHTIKPCHLDEYEKKFHLWAYGTSHELCDDVKKIYWNALHGDLFLFSSSIAYEDEQKEKMYHHFDLHLEQLYVESNLYKARNEI